MPRVERTWSVDDAWLRRIRIAWPTTHDWVSAHFSADQLRSGIELNGVRVEPREIPQPHER